jgi:hypothetical protein
MNHKTKQHDNGKAAQPNKPLEVVPEGSIPPCPAEGFAGDKTPEVVAWWFKYHPEEAALKYAGRKYEIPTDS